MICQRTNAVSRVLSLSTIFSHRMGFRGYFSASRAGTGAITTTTAATARTSCSARASPVRTAPSSAPAATASRNCTAATANGTATWTPPTSSIARPNIPVCRHLFVQMTGPSSFQISFFFHSMGKGLISCHLQVFLFCLY